MMDPVPHGVVERVHGHLAGGGFGIVGEANTERNENPRGARSIRILYMHTMGFDNTL